ncbi:MAG: hypothetical protein ACR2PL_25685, partial [Dehalococcoidia bacterium]
MTRRLVLLLLVPLTLALANQAQPDRVRVSAQNPQPAAATVPPAAARNRHYQAQFAFYGPRLEGLRSDESYSQALAAALGQREALAQVSISSSATPAWTNLGPSPIRNGQLGNPPTQGVPQPVTGHIVSIAVDPTNAATVYVASEGGGLWKTTNGGSIWSPLTDSITVSGVPVTLSMGAVALDPTNPSIIYAGLGDECFCGVKSGLAVAGVLGSLGLLKSTDGGTTWTLVATDSAFTIPGFTAPAGSLSFARIVVDPTGPTGCAGGLCRIWAATYLGLYKSSDGGVTWALVIGGADPTVPSGPLPFLSATDIALDGSFSPATVYASINNFNGDAKQNGVYRSTGGASFVQLTKAINGLPDGSSAYVGRTSLAIDPRNHTVYAAMGHGLNDPAPSAQAIADQFLGVYKSLDGIHWNLASSTCQFGATSGPCSNYQSEYGNVLAVDSANGDLLFGATYIYRSTNGGQSWTDVSQLNSNGVHVDQHALVFANGTLWLGNDGGVWSSTNDGSSWTNHNGGGLVTTEFYEGGSVAPSDPSLLLAGSQDTGSVFTIGGASAWSKISGGDGIATAIVPRTPVAGNSGPWYAQYPFFGAILRIDNPTSSSPQITDISYGLNKDGAGFPSPFILDPGHPDRVYAGSQVVSVNTEPRFGTWRVISQPLTTSFISVVAVASGDPNGGTLFAGTRDGRVWKSTSGPNSATWSEITANLPARKITSLTTDGAATPTVFVATSGFGSLHIAKLPPGATSWTDVS